MKNYDIESSKNSIYRSFLELLTTKGIIESQKALIFGRKATRDILNEHPDRVEAIIGEKESLKNNLEDIQKNTYSLSSSLFKTLDIFGTHQPILLVRVPEILEVSIQNKMSGCTLLIPFQDPSNVGTLLRSAAGFGVDQILLAPGAAHPFHPRSTRAASGTVFQHRYFKISELSKLKEIFEIQLALDMKGENLAHFNFPKNFLLSPGVEGPGLSDEIKNRATSFISISLNSAVESLNAAVAASIVLYDWDKKKL